MDGILILDKPEGFTSFDCVAKLRGIYHIKKIGHGGTLDPMATGVLPVFIGNATKAISYADDTSKEYVAGIRFGIKTDTGDRTGTVTEKSEIMPVEAQLREALARFTGRITQIPPMYSAIKVGGKKLYDLARAGKTVERAPREIEIFGLELMEYDPEEMYARIRVACSSGTYIRTLAEDIAESLGTVASLCSLRRTMCMGFRENEAVTFGELEGSEAPGSYLRDMTDVFSSAGQLDLDEKNAFRFVHGGEVVTDIESGSTIKVFCGGTLLGIARSESGKLKKLIHISEGDLVR